MKNVNHIRAIIRSLRDTLMTLSEQIRLKTDERMGLGLATFIHSYCANDDLIELIERFPKKIRGALDRDET